MLIFREANSSSLRATLSEVDKGVSELVSFKTRLVEVRIALRSLQNRSAQLVHIAKLLSEILRHLFTLAVLSETASRKTVDFLEVKMS